MDEQKEIAQLRQRVDELERKQTPKSTPKQAASNSNLKTIYGIVIVSMVVLFFLTILIQNDNQNRINFNFEQGVDCHWVTNEFYTRIECHHHDPPEELTRGIDTTPYAAFLLVAFFIGLLAVAGYLNEASKQEKTQLSNKPKSSSRKWPSTYKDTSQKKKNDVSVETLIILGFLVVLITALIVFILLPR